MMYYFISFADIMRYLNMMKRLVEIYRLKMDR